MSKIKKTRAAAILIVLITFLFILIYFNPSYSKHFRYLNFDSALSIISANNFFSDYKIKNEKKIRYFVQLGVFAKPHEVDKIKARSLILGLMPTIKKRLINGKLMTRVTLGPYISERSLNKTLKKLENNNIEYYIINE